MSARPDSFVLGRDPEAGKEENAGVCAKCGRGWPGVRFSKAVAEDQLGESGKPILCDSCQPSSLETEIAQKIDEATGAAPTPTLIRRVEVTGIISKTNMVAFRFVTHIAEQKLDASDAEVTFRGKQTAEGAQGTPVYIYKDIPLPVLEAWYAAPSLGSYFAEFIKNSYPSERKA